VDPDRVGVVRAPYRFCPVGAHVDHQEGTVTGWALDRAVFLAFVPRDDGLVTLASRDDPEPVAFDVTAPPSVAPAGWARYPAGAAAVLGATHGITRGLDGLVAGEMTPGGVSTSAALGVAILLALETVNDLALDAATNVELDRRLENEYLGLQNGILDPSVILRARPGHLFELDCRTGATAWHPASERMGELCLVAVHSGIVASLAHTGYNQRVDECRAAARALLLAAGRPAPEDAVLRDVPDEAFLAHAHALEPVLRRRAAHYVSEMARVREGVAAWRDGDLARLGGILSATCESSIVHYECGSPELVRLFDLLRGLPGVHGARFAGAGFRGHAVALVDPARAQDVADEAVAQTRAAAPDRAHAVHAHVVRDAHGAAVIASPEMA
jgi:galactokinase/galacturonokinase